MEERLIAKRKLRNKCWHCNKEFSKGEIYYKVRFPRPYGNLYECSKCRYKRERSLERELKLFGISLKEE